MKPTTEPPPWQQPAFWAGLLTPPVFVLPAVIVMLLRALVLRQFLDWYYPDVLQLSVARAYGLALIVSLLCPRVRNTTETVAAAALGRGCGECAFFLLLGFLGSFFV